MSPEAAARLSLAQGWRVLGGLDLVDTIFNRGSIGIANGAAVPDSFVMNSPVRLASQATPANVVRLGVESNDDLEDLGASNRDGVALHRRIHGGDKGPVAALHLHSPASTAFSCTTLPWAPISQTVAEVCGRVERVGYEGLFRAGSSSDTRAVKSSLDRNVVLLKNHGVLIVSDSMAEAVYIAYYVEESCRQLLATALLEVQLIDATTARSVGELLSADRPVAARRLFDAWVAEFCEGLGVL